MPDHLTALDDELVVGGHPSDPDDVASLRSNWGIRSVICLQTDDDLVERGLPWDVLWTIYTRERVRVRRLPVPDLDAGTLRRRLDEIVEAIRGEVAQGRRTYVHCNAGMNRSPTAVIAYLVAVRGLPLDEATGYVTDCHVAMPHVEVLRQWVRSHGYPEQRK